MRKFATALNCIDGRVQLPVINYLKKNYNVEYVDMITAPGINKILAKNKNSTIEMIKNCLKISLSIHKSKLIALVGHYDCAGNPAEKKSQLNDILTAVETIDLWTFDVDVIGLWVDENWKVSLVHY